MDFKRIEWIFLIVFIGINIFLGIEIFQTPTLLSQSTTNRSSVDLKTEIKTDNIKVPKLSNAQYDGYYLAAKVDTNWEKQASSQINSTFATSYEENTLNVSLTEPVRISHQAKKRLAEIKKFVADDKNVFEGNKYQYVSQLSSDEEYVFDQKTDYGLTYSPESRIYIRVKNNQITSYLQTYTKSLTPVRERQTTISAQSAIESLYTYSELPNNSKVLWTKFGYSKLIEVRGSVIYIPAWTVAIENNTTKSITIKTVNAFTGNIIHDDTAENKNLT